LDNSALGKAPSVAGSSIHSRIAGTLYGAVCANSLGASGIGLNHKDISATVGLSGLRDFTPGLSRSHMPDHQPGQLLADAYLGLVLGESIVHERGQLNAADLKNRFAELLSNETFANASAGVHCISSMRCLVDGVEPPENTPSSMHVSAATRVFAIGCLPGITATADAVELAAKQANLTHGDKRAAASAAVIADSINYLVRGARLDTADQVREYVNREIEIANRFDERFAEAWDDIAPDLDYTSPAEELPYSLVNVQPTVTELVPTAVGIFLIFRHSAEEAICAAARSGGDTDKVAIIVGALSGAYHGVDAIPERWREKIQHKERIDDLLNGINRFWT
jgi:ADP-ribosylglycohydrolase